MIRTVAGAYPDQWWAYDDETPELTGLGNTAELAEQDLLNQQRKAAELVASHDHR